MLQKFLSGTSKRRAIYENDCPDKKTETDTDNDAPRKYVSANMTNRIRDTTVMLQEGVHDGEFDGDETFSAFSLFSTGHEPMKP